MATERVQISIDRFGRVVLPKGIRDRLGLSAGTEFEVEERAEVILLKPLIPPAKIINKGGWLVIQSEGPPVTQEDVNKTRDKIRKEREEKFLR